LVARKPPPLHLVLTGRGAPPELIEAADLVSEVRPIKHPYERGIKAQRGIEF
jgi:cob(I)alamin adenosyltransferase